MNKVKTNGTEDLKKEKQTNHRNKGIKNEQKSRKKEVKANGTKE